MVVLGLPHLLAVQLPRMLVVAAGVNETQLTRLV